MIYIYRLLDPDSLEVRYVGQTQNTERRLHEHIMGAGGNPSKRNQREIWIANLVKNSKRPSLELVEECPDKEHANYRESYWLIWHLLQGHKMTNGLTPALQRITDYKIDIVSNETFEAHVSGANGKKLLVAFGDTECKAYQIALLFIRAMIADAKASNYPKW